MFERLKEPRPDVVMQVTEDFRADTRKDKIDLSVGVYKDADNKSAIFKSVLAAEKQLLDAQTSKAYVGTLGNKAFSDLMAELLLGRGFCADETAVVQTPGGVSALRLLIELVAVANPDAKIWVPAPTWGNHLPIIQQVDVPFFEYPYYDASTGSVDFAAMRDTLINIPKGDIVLLQGCCHNPTGADLSTCQWDEISEILLATGAIPLVDMAYQGLSRGLDEDAEGLRILAQKLPELMVATTCSKNFAIYRERVGVALIQCKDTDMQPRILGSMAQLAQANYGMPPDHGASVVQNILSNPDLKQQWEAEVAEMRLRINDIRGALAQALRVETNSDRFDFLKTQCGLFSLLGLTPEQVGALRDKHAIFMMGNGRCNIAGLRSEDVTKFARAIADVVRSAA